ncbi:MAG TPA: DUF4157 domain-containing protein [Candidatus Angelobacter sp.]|jgi:hypothetical protein|nr:DUF4157 domain-containing protein [Candidatus Angelobacter sp.]
MRRENSKPQEASVHPCLNFRGRGLLEGIHPQTLARTGTGLLQRKVSCAISQVQLAPSLMRAPASGLTLNQPGDQYEQEAERVAEQVMRMPEPANMQRQAASSGAADTLQRKCTDCEEEENQLQRQGTGAGPAAAPPIVHEVLSSPGQPLDASTRRFMEPRFGHDFGHVRVHADDKAGESAEAIQALAYTMRNNIVFAPRRFAPESSIGKRLLAHELAHVIQQSGSEAVVQRQNECDDPTFCTPYDTPAEATAAKADLFANLIPKLLIWFGPEVASLWIRYLTRQRGDSLNRVVFDTDGNNVVESFKSSGAIKDDQDKVLDLIESRMSGIILSDYVPTMYGLSTFLSADEMVRDINFSNPFSIAGNIAGGISGSDAGPDLRRIEWGNVFLERKPLAGGIGYTNLETTLHYEVLDAIDFCPGSCGATIEQQYTIPLSRLEATGEAYDVPFSVKFVPPSRSRRAWFS